MSRRRIGQKSFGFGDRRGRQSSLDELAKLIDWTRVEAQFVDISSSAKGEPAWPPLALFKARLLSVWYDLSDAKLAEALDDRASFRRFCGFSGNEATPERTAFLRFRKALTVRALDKLLSRVTLAARLAGKAAAETISVMLAVFGRIHPALRKSVTFDNDTTFAQHALLRTMRDMTTWFCDAYASWQKGGVENAVNAGANLLRLAGVKMHHA